MSPELKEYTENLPIFVYRMIDGSIVIAEENHRDIADNFIIVSRPLQILRTIEEHTVKTVFIPWMAGDTNHIKIELESILAETEATFGEKVGYCQYFLLNKLKDVMSPEEFAETIKSDIAKAQSKADTTDLINQLNKQKRFDLN